MIIITVPYIHIYLWLFSLIGFQCIGLFSWRRLRAARQLEFLCVYVYIYIQKQQQQNNINNHSMNMFVLCWSPKATLLARVDRNGANILRMWIWVYSYRKAILPMSACFWKITQWHVYYVYIRIQRAHLYIMWMNVRFDLIQQPHVKEFSPDKQKKKSSERRQVSTVDGRRGSRGRALYYVCLSDCSAYSCTVSLLNGTIDRWW